MTASSKPLHNDSIEATILFGCIEAADSLWLHRGKNLVVAASTQPTRSGDIEAASSLQQHRGNNLAVAASNQPHSCGCNNLVVAPSSQPLNFGCIEASSSFGLHQGNNHIVDASTQPLWLYRGKNFRVAASRQQAHYCCIEPNPFCGCIVATISLWLN